MNIFDVTGLVVKKEFSIVLHQVFKINKIDGFHPINKIGFLCRSFLAVAYKKHLAIPSSLLFVIVHIPLHVAYEANNVTSQIQFH